MPRWLADLVTRQRCGTTYRSWIYGVRGYERLLRQARFTGMAVCASLPTYHHSEVVVPLQRADLIRKCPGTGSHLTCLVLDALARIGLLGQIVNSLCISAEQL
jgi:hypothetical protein